ncbi:secreted RxLR effector protein 161-like [Lathyrus oleraceus]|uniref:secreted RxLR effector protein 161-like n=1 Tax=Pisum sativum TaxID=3888 RepID=UPI0021CF757A|nr:secreted RxLR effector protein 161-like [Pisum sativum]
MDNCKAMSTPMGSGTYVDQDESDVSIDIRKYRGMIGSLLYLTTSCPDIMFSVCLCARFQANPKESHLIVVKRIMKYLKGTTNFGLWYPKSSIYNLVGYSDVDHSGSKTDRKSTSGTCHILGNALVSWACKKQACVALSTTEAEYIAAVFHSVDGESPPMRAIGLNRVVEVVIVCPLPHGGSLLCTPSTIIE